MKTLLSKIGSSCLAGLALLGSLAGTAHAHGFNEVRYKVNQKGDFALIGQSLGTECFAGVFVPPPIIGTIGNCGFNQNDTGIDAYWLCDSPAVGQCQADISITSEQARSTAQLNLPPGATVTKAYLYWSARLDLPTLEHPEQSDQQVTLDRQGGFSATVNAFDVYEFFHPDPLQIDQYFYHSVADVTSLVQANGSGPYRVSGVFGADVTNSLNNVNYSAWWMVVVYSLPSDPFRNITIYDGFHFTGIDKNLLIDLDGFAIPAGGTSGKLAAIAFDGDAGPAGDQIAFKNNLLSDAENPANNFFNSSRSYLGAKVSNPGDLPLLVGGTNSTSGMDLDVMDVSPYLVVGDTAAQVHVSTLGDDGYFFSGLVTSLNTVFPDFASSNKTALDLNGGQVDPGDIIEYTVIATNTGNDTAVNTKITDVVPTGLTFVPGSIQVTAGPNAGVKTDAAGDDEGEYSAALRTVTVRAGVGATGVLGGSMAPGASTTFKFKAKVDAGAFGNISNQANIIATGQTGAVLTTWPTDSNPNVDGAQPVSLLVDQCEADADCSGGKPYCHVAPTPNLCVECLVDAQCGNLKPKCSANSKACICIPAGIEVCGNNVDEDCNGTICECLIDSDCGGPKSGKICDPQSQCIDGCRGMNGNGCPNPMLCTSVTASAGTCVGCLSDATCGGASSGKVCDTFDVCSDGCRGVGGNGCPAGEICTSADATIGQCFGCISDADCGGATSGKVCDPGTNQCAPGCRGVGGNGCPASEVCTSVTPAIGACVECLDDAACGSATSGKVCDLTTDTCVDGCRGKDGNGCAAGFACTSINAAIGSCVQCVDDSDCGGATSGKICDAATMTCKDGCRGMKGNDCPSGKVCTSTDPSPGQCVGCTSDVTCGAFDSGKVCDTAVDSCVTGCRGHGGNGCPSGQACSSTDSTIGACGCVKDAECGGEDSGKVCDPTTRLCADGCRGKGGNRCGGGLACTSTTTAIGTCKGCETDADCGATDSGKICDPVAKTCSAGCRGTNGNGCPSTEDCSSTDDSAGTCGAPGGDLAGQGHGILCSTRAGDTGDDGSPWLFGGALGALLAFRRRRRAA